MKRPFKKYIAAISILLVVMVPLITYSCGPYLDPSDAVFRLFMPKQGPPSLLSFNYTPALTSYVSYDSVYESPDDRSNAQEWRTFTNNSASINDINVLQYNTNPDDFLYAYSTNNWDKFEGNSFTDWLRKKKNRKALEYFAFAKKVEFLQTSYERGWEEESPRSDIIAYDSLSTVAQKLTTQTKSDFLSNRYAFQAVKLLYYTRLYSSDTYENANVVSFYNAHLKGKNTIVADWALIYYSLSQPDILQRNYYLAQVFDRTDEKKDYAYQWFNKEALDTLANTLTDVNDLVLIRTIRSMMNPGRGLKDLKYIVSKQPGSKYIPLLITREINKLEDWIWSPEVLGFSSNVKENLYNKEKYARESTGSGGADTGYLYYSDKNLQKDKVYLNDVAIYLRSIKDASADKDFLNLALAHIANMQGKHNDAVALLKKINSNANKYLLRQAHIEEILAIANGEDIKNITTKEKIYELVHIMNIAGDSLTRSSYWDYDGDEEKDDLSELFEVLSKRFQQESDLVTAGLLHYNANIQTNQYGYTCQDSICYGALAYWDKFGSPSDIDAIIALKHKTNKTNFEQMISPVIWADDNFYLDLKGTLFIRQQKYEDALRVFENMPDSFWNTRYEYANYLPKTTLTSVGTLLPVKTGTGKEYPVVSKKLLIKEVVNLQHSLAKAKTDKEKARLYFMLANAEYNMSYDGISWMMFAYGYSSIGSYSSNDNYDWVYYAVYDSPNNHIENYYGCQSAIQLYQKALSLAKTDKELAAQCLIMLSLCDNTYKYYLAEKNNVPGIYNYSDEKPHYTNYLKMLVKQYSSTRTFTLSKTTCPDIQEYLSHK
jgi:hypothetical protein